MTRFYVTTAIAYPNGKPHLGHALEIVQADIVARFHRLLGEDVFFQTGTDEHGIKNWQTAKKQGKDVLDLLDENVGAYKEMYKQLSITHDQFIRTTDEQLHHPGAKELWRRLQQAGDVYKKQYKGFYCSGCEIFKLERELEDGKCPIHPTRDIEIVEEENYFFKLSKYKDQVAQKITSGDYEVVPEGAKKEILSFLEDAKDISFSRPKKSLPWGIPVPDDEEHVMYVWCDALSNYITGVGFGRDEKSFSRWWPCNTHMIGKDILRFHAAFWPAMLLSAQIELPKKLFVHGFILSSGAKMSKSTGNVVDPIEQISRYGSDIFRFALAHSMPFEGDGDYSESVLLERVNSELVSNVSNFCYRTLSFIKKNYEGKISVSATNPVQEKVVAVEKKVLDAYSGFEFRRAIDDILHLSQLGNGYIQEAEPWKNKEGGQDVLTLCANIVKDLSILLMPIMPAFAGKLQEQLAVTNLFTKDLGFNLENHTISEPEILLRKLEVEEKKEESGAGILQLQVRKIVSVEKHPNAEKLFIEKLDDGRQIVSGLVGHYSAEELVGRKIILISNLKPAKLRGVLSEGMLLAADNKEVVEVLEPKGDVGESVVIEGFDQSTDEISIDQFSKLKLKVKDHIVYCNGARLLCNGKEVVAKKVENGKVR